MKFRFAHFFRRLGVFLCMASTCLASASAQSTTLRIRAVPAGSELRFFATNGFNHQVQWLGNLGTTNWVALTNVVSSNQNVTVIDSAVTSLPARFYRLASEATVQTNVLVILDNLANTSDGANGASSVDVAGGTPLFDASRVAVGFTMGGTSRSGSWTFTIRADNPNSAPVVLTLVNDNSGAPAATTPFALSASTLVASVPGGGSGYTASGSGTLSANTKYWLVASAGPDFNDFYSWLERRLPVNPPYSGSAAFAGVQLDNSGWGPQNGFFPGLAVHLVPTP